MATVNKEIALELLNNGGWYPGDPQCHSIWMYTHVTGRICFAIYYQPTILRESGWVQNPILIWDNVNGLTKEGKELLMNELMKKHTENYSKGLPD